MLKKILVYGGTFLGGVVTTIVVQKVVRAVRTPAQAETPFSGARAA